jgi:hypothetical protein
MLIEGLLRSAGAGSVAEKIKKRSGSRRGACTSCRGRGGVLAVETNSGRGHYTKSVD